MNTLKTLMVTALLTSTTLGSAAQADILPASTEVKLICGAPNYVAFTSSSALSFVNSSDETYLENNNLSVMQAGTTLAISGVAETSDFWKPISLKNAEGLVKTYYISAEAPRPLNEYGTVVPMTVNLTVKAGETLDISAALRAANASLDEFPQVQPGFFSNFKETELLYTGGVSFSDKGRLTATGFPFDGAGPQYSFKAHAEAKSGKIEFEYNLRQRLEGPAGAGCDNWAQTAQGRVIVTVDEVKDSEQENPVEPGTPSSGAKFVFRYPGKEANSRTN